jgi:replicative DNA helicase
VSQPEPDAGVAPHAEGSKMRGIPTGVQDLDTLIGGWQGADLVIITTPSSVSQMSLTLSMTLHVAKTSKQGMGFFSLEMNKHRLVQSLLAMRTGIDLHRLRTGWITDEEHALVMATARTLSKAHLWIDDTPDLSLTQLRQRARQLVEAHHITLILVDHPSVIQPSVHGTRHEKRLQELGEIHHSLKALAGELNIPVVVFVPIACSVASRGSKRPQHADSRESAPEKAIDHVLFLYRDELAELGVESNNVVICRIMVTNHQYGQVTEVDISV